MLSKTSTGSASLRFRSVQAFPSSPLLSHSHLPGVQISCPLARQWQVPMATVQRDEAEHFRLSRLLPAFHRQDDQLSLEILERLPRPFLLCLLVARSSLMPSACTRFTALIASLRSDERLAMAPRISSSLSQLLSFSKSALTYLTLCRTTPAGDENLPDSWTSKFGHSRKVSFKLSVHEPRHLLGISLPSSLRSNTGATDGSSPTPSSGSSISPNELTNRDVASSVPAQFRLSSCSFGSDGKVPSPFTFTFSGPGNELRCPGSIPSSPLLTQTA